MRGFACLAEAAVLLAALQCAVPSALAQVGKSPASAPSTQAVPQSKDGPRITVAPAAITFPDLAKKLSAPGRKVICPRAFSQRAAVVCLKNRTWSDTREVLEHALELKIVETSPGEWTFRLDQAIVRRDRKRLDILCEMLRKELAKKAIPASPVTNARALNGAAIAQRYTSLTPRAEIIAYTDPRLTKQAEATLLAEWRGLRRAMRPAGWIAMVVAPKISAQTIEAALRGATDYIRTNSLSRFDAQAALSVERHDYDRRLSELRKMADSGDRYAERIIRDMEATPPTLKPYHDAFYRLTSTSMGNSIEIECLMVTYSGIDQDSDTDAGIDLDAVLRYSDSSEGTLSQARQLLSDPTPKPDIAQKLLIDRSLSTVSLSQVVETWCKTTGRDAVLELFPTREEADVSEDTDFEDDDKGENPGYKAATLQTVLDSIYITSSWSVNQKLGTLIFTNEYAFVDRLREMPLPSMLKLEARCSQLATVNGSRQTPELTDIAAFFRTTTPDQSAVAYNAWTYRGVSFDKFCTTRPHVLLMASLGTTLLNKLQHQLKNDPMRIPITRFSPAARRVALASLESLSRYGNDERSYTERLLPAFGLSLERKLLILRLSQEDNISTLSMGISNGIQAEDRDPTSIDVELEFGPIRPVVRR